jgi:hypothetical protein
LLSLWESAASQTALEESRAFTKLVVSSLLQRSKIAERERVLADETVSRAALAEDQYAEFNAIGKLWHSTVPKKVRLYVTPLPQQPGVPSRGRENAFDRVSFAALVEIENEAMARASILALERQQRSSVIVSISSAKSTLRRLTLLPRAPLQQQDKRGLRPSTKHFERPPPHEQQQAARATSEMTNDEATDVHDLARVND